MPNSDVTSPSLSQDNGHLQAQINGYSFRDSLLSWPWHSFGMLRLTTLQRARYCYGKDASRLFVEVFVGRLHAMLCRYRAEFNASLCYYFCARLCPCTSLPQRFRLAASQRACSCQAFSLLNASTLSTVLFIRLHEILRRCCADLYAFVVWLRHLSKTVWAKNAVALTGVGSLMNSRVLRRADQQWLTRDEI